MTVIATILLSFTVVVLVMLAMGIGVMAGRAPLKGSCGGLNGAGGCELCKGHCQRRTDGGGES
jgi:hypothetical protein